MIDFIRGFQLFIFLLLLSFDVLAAIPGVPGFSLTRAGTTTTYKILGRGGSPPVGSSASTGTGIIPLNSAQSATASGYSNSSGIPVGDTIAAVKVGAGITNEMLINAASFLTPKLIPLGMAIQVGSALYNYFKDAGLDVSFDGTEVGSAPVSSTRTDLSSGCTDVYSTPSAYCSGLYFGAAAVNFYISDRGNVTFDCQRSTGSIAGYNRTCLANYDNQCVFPNVWDATYEFCSTSSVPFAPKTPDEIADVLRAHDSPSNFAPIVKDIVDISPADAPESNCCQIDLSKGPYSDSVPSDATNTWEHQSSDGTWTNRSPDTTTTVSPDGTLQTTTETTTLTQTASDSFTGTKSATVTTTAADGTVSTVTIDIGVSGNSPTEQKTDCDNHPEYIGCSEYGDVQPAEHVDEIEVDVNFDPNSLGSGYCPMSFVMSLSHANISFDYSQYCDFAQMIRPMLVAFAWLSAGIIVLGAVR